MAHYQGLGLLLLATGILILFSLTRFWSNTKRDPRWILRGELGGVFGDHLGPEAVQLVNAILLILGIIAGAVGLALGLVFLRWL